MLVLGIDPGTATTGYGLIKKNGSSIYEVRQFGLIETSKDKDPHKRLQRIEIELTQVIKTYSPDVMAMEKLFFATNAKTAIRVGQAQGVILLCAAKTNIPVFEYAPGSIKKQVAGNGRADKKELQRSLRKILGAGIRSKRHKKTHFDNEADALAVAMCHIMQGG